QLLGLPVGEIGDDGLDLHAVLTAQALSGLGETIGAAGDQDEGDATTSESSGEGGPDACGATGDQGLMHGGYDTLAPPCSARHSPAPRWARHSRNPPDRKIT